MRERPLVGVTGPDRGGYAAWVMTGLALRRQGARPLRITPSRPADEGRLDALVVGGGTDVDPVQYGQERDEPEPGGRSGRVRLLDWTVGLLLTAARMLLASRSRQSYDPERDQLETRLVRHALYHELPVLGICRGAQLMNVVLGGTLHRDIGHFYTEETHNVRSILPSKLVTVVDQSRLGRILGRDRCRVNALHDQSVDRLGEPLRVAAREPSGVIQAIEHPEHPWFIGVQWHPEYIPQSRVQQGLFQGLVECARERVGGSRG